MVWYRKWWWAHVFPFCSCIQIICYRLCRAAICSWVDSSFFSHRWNWRNTLHIWSYQWVFLEVIKTSLQGIFFAWRYNHTNSSLSCFYVACRRDYLDLSDRNFSYLLSWPSKSRAWRIGVIFIVRLALLSSFRLIILDWPPSSQDLWSFCFSAIRYISYLVGIFYLFMRGFRGWRLSFIYACFACVGFLILSGWGYLFQARTSLLFYLLRGGIYQPKSIS